MIYDYIVCETNFPNACLFLFQHEIAFIQEDEIRGPGGLYIVKFPLEVERQRNLVLFWEKKGITIIEERRNTRAS